MNKITRSIYKFIANQFYPKLVAPISTDFLSNGTIQNKVLGKFADKQEEILFNQQRILHQLDSIKKILILMAIIMGSTAWDLRNKSIHKVN